jgi:hypothetical protein
MGLGAECSGCWTKKEGEKGIMELIMIAGGLFLSGDFAGNGHFAGGMGAF